MSTSLPAPDWSRRRWLRWALPAALISAAGCQMMRARSSEPHAAAAQRPTKKKGAPQEFSCGEKCPPAIP